MLMFIPGILDSSFAHDKRVEPVVMMSSMSRICLPSNSCVELILNIFLTFSFRSAKLRCVCEGLEICRRITWVLMGMCVTV